MRHAMLLLWILLLACPPARDDDDAGDDDAGDDDVGDDDTGDDDAGDDDAGDDDTTRTDCTSDDLVVRQVVMNALGLWGTSFTTDDSLRLVGEVINECGNAVAFTTNDSCLMSSWSLQGPGTGTGMGCDDAITDWTLQPGERVSQTEDVGQLPVGNYTFGMQFQGGQQRVLLFSVTEAQ
jgi:hypothetical protein